MCRRVPALPSMWYWASRTVVEKSHSFMLVFVPHVPTHCHVVPTCRALKVFRLRFHLGKRSYAWRLLNTLLHTPDVLLLC